MDQSRLQQISTRLEELEQQRREVMNQLVEQVGQAHDKGARELYGRLSAITQDAQELLVQQREIAEKAVGNLHLPGQPGHGIADRPEIGRAT